jgi:hypothetical protein
MSISNLLVPNNYDLDIGSISSSNITTGTLTVNTQSTLNTLTTVNGIMNVHATLNATNGVNVSGSDVIITGGDYEYGSGGGLITSNTYTPTITNVTGASAISPQLSAWFQIKNKVIVYLAFNYVSNGSAVSLLCSLPVARSITGNFVSIYDAPGSGSQFDNSASDVTGVFIRANLASQQVSILAHIPATPAVAIYVNSSFEYFL